LKQTDQGKQLQSWLYSAHLWLNRTRDALAVRDGLSPGWQFLVFGLVMIALFSRGPKLLTHAQFYAEDGSIWFAQAYNDGWLHSLTVPQAGYLNTMPRLGAGLALSVPLTWAPLVMAVVGMVVQAVPVPILLSARLRHWASLPTRMLLAAIYVALPNVHEIHIVVTNAQWHLALAAALVALAASPQSWSSRFCDIALILGAALTGPYCIVLAPVVLMFWWLRRQPWSLVIFAVSAIGASTQIWLLQRSHRVQGPLGASLASFLRMLGGHVVACAMVGSYSFASLTPMTFIVPAALGGLCIGFYCLRFAGLEWKLFLIYCVALFAASLRSPLTPGDMPAWDALLVDNSARYWFFPMLAFVWSAVWCAVYGRDRLFRIAGTSILLIMPVGIYRDWKCAPFYSDDHFAASVLRLREAKPGDHVVIPIAPNGWHMDLVKKGS
jgi:hypothetical protein